MIQPASKLGTAWPTFLPAAEQLNRKILSFQRDSLLTNPQDVILPVTIAVRRPWLLKWTAGEEAEGETAGS